MYKFIDLRLLKPRVNIWELSDQGQVLDGLLDPGFGGVAENPL
jgi:hypothetical protein